MKSKSILLLQIYIFLTITLFSYTLVSASIFYGAEADNIWQIDSTSWNYEHCRHDYILGPKVLEYGLISWYNWKNWIKLGL